VNVLVAAGAAAAIAGVIGGAVVAFFFGKRATIGVEARLVDSRGTSILVVRPSVTSLGFRKFKFSKQEPGGRIRVREVLSSRGHRSLGDDLYEVENVFGEQFANGGETITEESLIFVDPPGDAAVGWSVLFLATRRRLLRKPKSWRDRVFVACTQ
jgi:hypothetical protein